MKKYIKLTIMITAVVMLSLPLNIINIAAETNRAYGRRGDEWHDFVRMLDSPELQEQVEEMLYEMKYDLDLPRRPSIDWGAAWISEHGMIITDFQVVIYKSCLSLEEAYLISEWVVKLAELHQIPTIHPTTLLSEGERWFQLVDKIPIVNNFHLITERELTSQIVEEELTLFPTLTGYVSLTIDSIDKNKVSLNIINGSRHEILISHNNPCWFYFNAISIKIDYFDGENWRNISHDNAGRWIFIIPTYTSFILPYPLPYDENRPKRTFLGVQDSIIVEHCLHWHNIPIEEHQLFRIRKYIYTQTSNEVTPLVLFTRQHTLTAEFYWDGYEFRAVEPSPPPIQMPLVPSVPSLPSN